MAKRGRKKRNGREPPERGTDGGVHLALLLLGRTGQPGGFQQQLGGFQGVLKGGSGLRLPTRPGGKLRAAEEGETSG